MREYATRRDIIRYVKAIRVLLAIILVLAITVGILIYNVVSLNSKPKDSQNSLSAQTESTQSDTSSLPASSEENITSKTESTKDPSSNISSNESSVNQTSSKEIAVDNLADDLDNWNLKLVNPDNALPKGFKGNTTAIKSAYARDVGMSFDSRAVGKLNEMCKAAADDGVTLLVISGFRTNATQTRLYNNQINKQKAKYPNLSDAEIAKIAATISAYPGTSEHELGLAVDFNSVEETFEHTRQFEWLKNHAAEYGFIMRYSREKQPITKIIYEPWHYRYVGEQHAKKINELGYCLEEYIEYLKKQ